MFVVVVLVFLWLRPRETRRLWPADPGADRDQARASGHAWRDQAIVPSRRRPGRRAESQPGESGSGRIADLGPALRDGGQKPLLGQGFGTRVVDPNVRGPRRTSSTTSGSGRCSKRGSSASSVGSGSSSASCGGSARRRRRLRPRLAARLARGRRGRVRRRNADLRRVRVHPGHLPALHLRRARLGAARRRPTPLAAKRHAGRPGGDSPVPTAPSVSVRTCCTLRAPRAR